MTKPKLHPKTRRLARQLGLEIAEKRWPAWLGPGVVVGESDEDVLHEIAHWLVAPKSRKDVKWFGLRFWAADGPVRVSDCHADLEEEQASLLGIILLREFGLTEEYHRTLREHHWLGCGVRPLMKRALSRLKTKGLYPLWAQSQGVKFGVKPRKRVK